ncbi:hypothetical protein GCM10022393_29920 [Aquimarina addita]|uniref:DUF4350 domain-containing protein n=1 Tax=Aquimarina addita TaxID=870485 RepID=A0ABP6UN42_9FLAO
MDKRSRNILILLGFALIVIISTELLRPQPINWDTSYTSAATIPFGGYILYEELKDQEDKEITKISKNPYEFLNDSLDYQNSVYLFINSGFDFDKRSYEKLITFVEQGNSVFIAGTRYGSVFRDSLNIETETEYQFTEEEITPTFFTKSISLDTIPSFKKGIYKTVFKSFDTTSTTVLSYYKNEEEALNQVNFIKIKKGAGSLYLNTLPEAFSNYYMLDGNEVYAATSLSFIKDNSMIYWDDYLKDGRQIIDSPMRFILNQVSLQWAYYVLIIGLLLFVIFRGKREQRIIPVIEPLENSSIEFTKTIGDLYFQYKDYSNIISKKINYFLERTRSTYYLNTNELNPQFIEKLAVKSNHSLQETEELINYIRQLKEKTTHSEADLITLNKKIEAFTL